MTQSREFETEGADRLQRLHIEAAAAFGRGQFDLTLSMAHDLLGGDPQSGYAWVLIGGVHSRQGRKKDALDAFLRAAELQAGGDENTRNIAITYWELGHLDKARATLEPLTLRDRPDLEGMALLGFVLSKMGRDDEAEAVVRKASRAHYDLGNVLLGQGDVPSAQVAFAKACKAAPTNPDFHNNLGVTHIKLGTFEEALECFSRSRALMPDHIDTLVNLGFVYQRLGRLSEAKAVLERAIRASPNCVLAILNLASVLVDLGEIDNACAWHEALLNLDPTNVLAHDALLYALNYASRPAHSVRAAVSRYGALVASMAAHPFSTFTCSARPQRLRVGLVTADLREHPVGFFLESTLRNLDLDRIEVIVYSTLAGMSDGLTARVMPLISQYRSIDGLTDQAAAALINADGVHVLVDLGGHTGFNRTPIFAHRPAPVQVTWLGYGATTGVEAIDFVLADPHDAPAGEEVHFTETIWRLPATRLCFTPPNDSPPVANLPMIRRGYPTFGCFNALTKMNDDVIRVWSRVLQQLPEAQLYLKTRGMDDRLVQQSVAERFARQGIGRDRLRMEGASHRTAYLFAFDEVDIALDPFPFPGGTTTMEGLWMGVPAVSLRGSRLIGRQGASILSNADLADWIADNEDDYVALAIRMASDGRSLSALRNGLRARLRTSPLLDGRRFAKDWTDALWGMWELRRGVIGVDGLPAAAAPVASEVPG